MLSTISKAAETHPQLIFQGEYCTIYQHPNGVLSMSFSDAYITDAALGVEGGKLKELLNGRRPNLIFNASNLQPLDKSIRLKLDALLSKHFSALAIVSDTKMGKMVSSIFITLSNSDLPKKFFDSEELALAWIESCTERE